MSLIPTKWITVGRSRLWGHCSISVLYCYEAKFVSVSSILTGITQYKDWADELEVWFTCRYGQGIPLFPTAFTTNSRPHSLSYPICLRYSVSEVQVAGAWIWSLPSISEPNYSWWYRLASCPHTFCWLVFNCVSGLLHHWSSIEELKVKLSVCMSWDLMQGSASIEPLFHNLGTRWRWVVKFTLRPLCPR
jgi:hypothetical protein